MKKILTLALIMILAVCFALAGIAESADAASAPETSVTEEVQSETTTEATPQKTWFQQAFKKLGEIQWYTWCLLAVLMIFGIVMCAKTKPQWTTRKLSYAAMCIAITFILGLIRLFRMPQGGSITLLSKLPLVLFTLACGPVYGLTAGCAAGLISLIFDPYVIHPIQLLVDYPFASGAVALAYVAKLIPIEKESVKLAVACGFGYLGSFIMAVLSGVVFFAEYAPEGQSALVYSLGYNAAYTVPECLICVVIVLTVPGISRLVDYIGGKAR